ncbi:MAG: hypothetical protein V1701_11480 [Planctomycetota bacterium]
MDDTALKALQNKINNSDCPYNNFHYMCVILYRQAERRILILYNKEEGGKDYEEANGVFDGNGNNCLGH